MKGAEQLTRSCRGSQRGAGRAGRGQDTGTGCPPPAGGRSRLRAASAGCAGPAGAGGGSRGFGFSPFSACILEAHRLSVGFFVIVVVFVVPAGFCGGGGMGMLPQRAHCCLSCCLRWFLPLIPWSSQGFPAVFRQCLPQRGLFRMGPERSPLLLIFQPIAPVLLSGLSFSSG